MTREQHVHYKKMRWMLFLERALSYNLVFRIILATGGQKTLTAWQLIRTEPRFGYQILTALVNNKGMANRDD